MGRLILDLTRGAAASGRLLSREKPSPGRFVESMIIDEGSALRVRVTLKHPTRSTPMPATNPLPTPIAWADAARRDAFTQWLDGIASRHGLKVDSLRLASADASFRRYFRIDSQAGDTFIVMDAPPPQENVQAFVKVAELLKQAGLNAPKVIAQDIEHGFLLITDLGTELYLPALQKAQAEGNSRGFDPLMRDAITALVQWQSRTDAQLLPAYDEPFLRRELALFPEWCVAREYGVTWRADQHAQWQAVCDALVRSALAQPTVAMHRDYMPRNLMICPAAAGNPGILDFQDAVRGPVSYDIASLLRDAFISWDEEQEIDWAIRYWQQARKASLPLPQDFGEFWRHIEWMGLQRHLKILGLFCRIKHRDGKPHYVSDLPRFFNYAHKVAVRYNGLGPLARLLEPLMGATRQNVYF